MSIANAVSILALMAFFGGLSAFFSAAETALFSLRRPQIARLRDTLPQRAATVDALFANPRRLLGIILLADTLANLPLCLLGLHFLHDYSSWHWHAPEALANDPTLVPFWSAALGLFVLIVFVCDLLPKMFALRQPERVARRGRGGRCTSCGPGSARCAAGCRPCSERPSATWLTPPAESARRSS